MDAYRHILYMSVFAQKIKPRKLRKLGLAHEKSNYQYYKKNRSEFGEIPDSLASVMDLYNNEIGFKIGTTNKKLPVLQLNQLVLTSLSNGEGLIFKRKKNGTYLDCFGKEIELNQYRGKWAIPKCLVSSNSDYID